MKGEFFSCIVSATLVAMLGCTRAADAQDSQTIIIRAQKAKASGDLVGALKGYNEAIGLMLRAGTPQEKIADYSIERDTLVAAILSQLMDIRARQAQIIQLQRGTDKKITKIAETDKDVQSRMKKNENKLKDIEGILLDATK
ncbi:MAG: hypothetical protein NT045_01930 [Candidatus Aureabacteria bacterium]|nr:hypothetical protein [Candidatus Auribacterota bacterium]